MVLALFQTIIMHFELHMQWIRVVEFPKRIRQGFWIICQNVIFMVADCYGQSFAVNSFLLPVHFRQLFFISVTLDGVSVIITL